MPVGVHISARSDFTELNNPRDYALFTVLISTVHFLIMLKQVKDSVRARSADGTVVR